MNSCIKTVQQQSSKEWECNTHRCHPECIPPPAALKISKCDSGRRYNDTRKNHNGYQRFSSKSRADESVNDICNVFLKKRPAWSVQRVCFSPSIWQSRRRDEQQSQANSFEQPPEAYVLCIPHERIEPITNGANQYSCNNQRMESDKAYS